MPTPVAEKFPAPRCADACYGVQLAVQALEQVGLEAPQGTRVSVTPETSMAVAPLSPPHHTPAELVEARLERGLAGVARVEQVDHGVEDAQAGGRRSSRSQRWPTGCMESMATRAELRSRASSIPRCRLLLGRRAGRVVEDRDPLQPVDVVVIGVTQVCPLRPEEAGVEAAMCWRSTRPRPSRRSTRR